MNSKDSFSDFGASHSDWGFSYRLICGYLPVEDGFDKFLLALSYGDVVFFVISQSQMYLHRALRRCWC